jgi:imidazole glycerol-phosphate synthase subunit HisH
MNVALIDYGVGNLHSLREALDACGANASIESDVAAALRADALVLPGVGAFNAAAERIAADLSRLRAALLGGHPCLGICLGMQLLFEGSEEGDGRGIGVLPGNVRRLSAPCLPHMGWNDVEHDDDPLFAGLDGFIAYFANSYAAEPGVATDTIARTCYERQTFASAVRRGRTWGVQFHPEKSGESGLQIIRNFIAAAQP